MCLQAKKGKTKFIIGNGENMMDFTYVGNVAQAHLQVRRRSSCVICVVCVYVCVCVCVRACACVCVSEWLCLCVGRICQMHALAYGSWMHVCVCQCVWAVSHANLGDSGLCCVLVWELSNTHASCLSDTMLLTQKSKDGSDKRNPTTGLVPAPTLVVF